MIVICNNVENNNNLTFNKKYEVIEDDTFYLDIIDDDGIRGWFKKNLFVSVEEFRDNRLDILLGDE